MDCELYLNDSTVLIPMRLPLPLRPLRSASLLVDEASMLAYDIIPGPWNLRRFVSLPQVRLSSASRFFEAAVGKEDCFKAALKIQ